MGSALSRHSSTRSGAAPPSWPIANAVAMTPSGRLVWSAARTSAAVPWARAEISASTSGAVATVAAAPNATALNTGANSAPPPVPASTGGVPGEAWTKRRLACPDGVSASSA